MTLRTERSAIVVFSALALASASACGPDQPPVQSHDATIFAAIADLDGVTSADVSYTDQLGMSHLYEGLVEVRPDADATCVLYQAVGLLMQGGRESDTPFVTVVQGDVSVDTSDLPFRIWSGLEELAASPASTPTVPDCAAADIGTPASSPSAAP